jgi:putrescine transport system substrate-binding protein
MFEKTQGASGPLCFLTILGIPMSLLVTVKLVFFVCTVFAATTLGAFATVKPIPERSAETIRVLNWSEYIDINLLAEFTKVTGINVEYVEYETESQATAIIMNSGFDVVGISSVRLVSMIQRNQLEAFINPMNYEISSLNRARTMGLSSDAQKFGMPYMWGRVGMMVDHEKLQTVLGGSEVNYTSSAMVYDLETVKKLSACGVGMLDDQASTLMSWANYRGHGLINMSVKKAVKFGEEIKALLPFYASTSSEEYLDKFPKGELCVSMMWEGDALAMMAESDNANLEFILPDEGATMFIDYIAVMASSTKKDEAKRFVDFMSSKEISLENSKYTGYNPPSVGAISAKSGFMFIAPPLETGVAIASVWKELFELDE